ncbi:hypothetical protein IPR95_22350 [Xanthomonas perforans]|nr:hypothetical protein [Xanthomonas perforans]MBZ2876678.1 hypothetical protein [Xanthomonas perforans]MBZ2945439.1 hypothetical protein [Xanthomonas perforans]MBZ2984126.1 hypothetical protein [Xanthomonas perforans]MBZ3005728.1 hypothetical protein [Xanthomonas perforans]
MNFADYCYGPLDDVLHALTGDFPPDDPVVLRVILSRCLGEIIAIKATQSSGATT